MVQERKRRTETSKPPDGSVRFGDKRLEGFICQGLLDWKGKKKITTFIENEAKNIPNVFLEYFKGINGWRYYGAYHNPTFFTKAGVDVILGANDLTDMKLKAGSPMKNYKRISESDFFVMKNALQQFIEKAESEK